MTPRVGNDVVDLDDPHNALAHLRARFVERVCREAERAQLATSATPHTLLWSFFAAKEAAFKVVAKLAPPPPFAHRRFVVSADLRSVRYEGRELFLVVEVGERYVHAIASTHEATPLRAVERVDASADHSLCARTLLRTSLGRALDCDPEDLEVVRPKVVGSWDGYGPPQLLTRGALREADVSLSHDGRFVACAAWFPTRASTAAA